MFNYAPRFWPVMVIAVLLTLTACGKKDTSPLTDTSGPLRYVPADTPYVLAGLEPAPDDFMDKMEPKIDQFLVTYQSILKAAMATATAEDGEEELDSKLTDIIMVGTEQLRDRLENGNVKYDGKTGQLYRQPLTSGELAKDTIGIMFDKRALLRGDPTSRIEKTSTDETLRLLANKFIEMTTDKEKPAIDITHEVIEGE